MEHIARSFNKLPRPQTTPTGLPNHWVFGIRHIPLTPPADVVVAVHPQSTYLVQGEPAQILSLPGASEKARTLVPLLLNAFVKQDVPGLTGNKVNSFAPWSWSIDDPGLAAAVRDELSISGINGTLSHVTTCSAEEKGILDDTFSRLLEKLSSMFTTGRVQHGGPSSAANASPSAVPLRDNTRCHGCGSGREKFPVPLMKCSACSLAWYHSKECQRLHWKLHRPACLANRSGTGGSSATAAASADPGVDAFRYYNEVARASPEARLLMQSLDLDPTSTQGTAKPLRRLVLTGRDTPENIQLLFGPASVKDMKEDHENTRIEILLDAPRGSPSDNLMRQYHSDALTRSVRPPTEAEQRKLKEVRAMQELIRQRVGAGNKPSTDDMKAILTSFGPDWSTKLQLYMLAVNTMD